MKEEEYIAKLIKELKEKIANREAMIAARGDRMPLLKYEELEKWKQQLNELENGIIPEEYIEQAKEVGVYIRPSYNSGPGSIKKGAPEAGDLDTDNLHNSKKLKKDLPPLNLSLNMRTGECILIDYENNEKYEMTIKNSDYTKQNLTNYIEYIYEKYQIPEEDKKYLKNVDPTIFKAYAIYDEENSGKYNQSAAKMYIDAVIDSSKKLENGQKINETEAKMPGKVTIDLRANYKLKDERDKEDKFKGLSGIINWLRARKILLKHSEKKMNLAEVLENKILKRLKVILGLGFTLLALIGGGAKIKQIGEASQGKLNDKPNIESIKGNDGKESSKGNIEIEDDEVVINTDIGQKEDDKEKTRNQENKSDTNENANQEKNINSDEEENLGENQVVKEETKKIELGSLVSPEKYSALYKSSDAIEPNGALGNVDRLIGVNKIACVIDGKIYSTKDYSTDQIYQMAEEAGVEVRYHLDEAAIIDGKICVQVKEEGSILPSYVYYEEGKLKYIDGREFLGDVQSGIGWIDSKQCQKSEKTLENQHTDTSKKKIFDENER